MVIDLVLICDVMVKILILCYYYFNRLFDERTNKFES